MPDTNCFHPFLVPGERVLWTGRPAANAPALRAEDAKSLLFLPFLIFGGFMLHMIADSGAPALVLWGFGGLIALLALSIAVSALLPVLYSRWLLPRLAYVVTDRRILRYRGSVVDALDARALPPMRLIPTRDGCGTISFAAEKKASLAAAAGGVSGYMTTPQSALSALFRASFASLDGIELFHIPEPEKVMALIAGLDRNAPAAEALSAVPLLPLGEDEKLLWQGRPDVPPLSFDYDWLELLPGLWMLLIGLGLEALFIAGSAPPWALLMGLLPLALGFDRVIGRSLRDRRQLADTVYVVTDRRILASTRGKTREFTPDSRHILGMTQARHGSGTVLLGHIDEALCRDPRRQTVLLNETPCFQLRFIPEAAQVMDVIAATRKDVSE